MDKQQLLAIYPASFKQLLSQSLRLYRISILHVFHLALLFSITVFIPRLSVMLGYGVFSMQSPFGYQRVWVELLGIAAIFFYAALLWRMRCQIFNMHESIFDDLKVALRRLLFILVASLIMTAIFTLFCLGLMIFYRFLLQHHVAVIQTGLFSLPLMMSGLLFYFIFVVYLYFLFIFYLPLILTEKKSVFTALGKSASLVWGNWWRTFGLQMTPWAIYLVVLVIIKMVFQVDLHLYFDLSRETSLFATVIHIFIFALFIPWVGAILLIQLRDLELRKNYTMLHGNKITPSSA
jgi:hypothetical protein